MGIAFQRHAGHRSVPSARQWALDELSGVITPSVTKIHFADIVTPFPPLALTRENMHRRMTRTSKFMAMIDEITKIQGASDNDDVIL